MSNYTELEFKYKADDIKLTEFVKLMQTVGFSKRLDISSWDHYYITKAPNVFQRYRESTTPELTKKVKTSETNNWERIEVDLPLDSSKITKDIVDKYVSLDGYIFKKSIYKSCFIFWLDNVNYVYYIVYDSDLKEKGRFIEVEVNKEKVELLDKSHWKAIDHLKQAAKLLEDIGLSPQNRLKKSLFEIYITE